MSQIIKASSGGGGGGIDVVNGTYPVLVNTSSSTATVSLAYNVVSWFVSPTIDFTQTGLSTVFTVGSGRQFIPTLCTLVLQNAVDVSAGGGFNLGINGPSYIDYINGNTSDMTAPNTFSDNIIQGSSDPIATAGTSIIFNSTTGITATTATGYVIVQGYYF